MEHLAEAEKLIKAGKYINSEKTCLKSPNLKHNYSWFQESKSCLVCNYCWRDLKVSTSLPYEGHW